MEMQEIENILFSAVQMLRARAPIDTGNLRYNSIKLERVGADNWIIRVDEEIAPYMCYTNEIWEHKIIRQGTFRKGETREVLRVWDNPNEGWWDEAVAEVVEFLTKKLGGIVKIGGQ